MPQPKNVVEIRSIPHTDSCIVVLKAGLSPETFKIIQDETIKYCNKLSENASPKRFIGVPLGGDVNFDELTMSAPLKHLIHPKVKEFVIYHTSKILISGIVAASEKLTPDKIKGFRDLEEFLNSLSDKEKKAVLPILKEE